MLDALPGSIIVASVLPVVVKGGAVPAVAVGAALLVMIATRRDFLAVIVGALVAAGARAAGLGV